MSSEAPPTLGEIEEFLDHHGLPEELRGPFEHFVVDFALRQVSLVQPNVTSLPSLFAQPHLDAAPTVPDTGPPRFDQDPADLPTHRMIDGPTALVRRELLGKGGMGNVYRAWEPVLNRVLAMKVLHSDLRRNAPIRAQFLVEASITAQLAHPGIPPVHAIGEHLGAPCFTMKEVQGRTLTSLIRGVHHGEVLPGTDIDAWSESRLLGVFHKVCEAVAYAHARGVVHCDLKPSNIMVGAFGEVMVMDWGVARLAEPTGGTGEPPVQISANQRTGLESAAGTPAYMPPEQAAGDLDLIGPPSDVFSLGVMLYELLTGALPFATRSNLQRVRMAMDGEITPLELPVGSIVDDTLRDILFKALAPLPAERFENALQLSEEIGRWREGSQRRERALARVREAEAVLPTVQPMRDRARRLRERATNRVETRAEAWTLEDEAAALEQRASLRLVQVVQKLHGALAHAPELSEAHELLARIHREQHQRAERRRDWAEAERQEILLRAHDLGPHEAYIAGMGHLSVVTNPPAQVGLHRFVDRGRRLEPSFVRDLGTSPLTEELTVGSYSLTLRASGCAEIDYPVHIDRTQGWSSVDPRGEPVVIELPSDDALLPGEVFVPGGWFLMGGDPDAPGSGPRERVWVDRFIMCRDPVTWREFSLFLTSPAGEQARAQTLHAGLGLFRPGWPATGMSWDQAMAYVRWRSGRDGLAWSLPSEAQWEKAARGVDGRWFPWGDRMEASFAHVRQGADAPVVPRSCARHPEDRSPYGVLGMAGNTRDWCLDSVVSRSVPQGSRVVRGGSFALPTQAAHCAARAIVDGEIGHVDVGLRLVRPLV